MKASVVVSVLNEETSIINLLNSLSNQTQKPEEIVIVDGGSRDKTIDLVKDFQKENKAIRLFVKPYASRSVSRNFGIEMSKSDIIAITDAGCIADKDWLKNITKPFEDPKTDMVAGFYEMVGKDTSISKALAFYLGVTPERFDEHFLASARSLAFRKSLWTKVGGFPEDLKDTAEDTVFNYKCIKAGVDIKRVKTAIVYWKIPQNLKEGFKKMFLYAKGDARSGIWWNPEKRFSTHNIKVLSVFLRYIIALGILFLSLNQHSLIFIFLICFLLYMLWSFRKVYMSSKDIRTGLAGIAVQFVSDLAVMGGFLEGIIGN